MTLCYKSKLRDKKMLTWLHKKRSQNLKNPVHKNKLQLKTVILHIYVVTSPFFFSFQKNSNNFYGENKIIVLVLNVVNKLQNCFLTKS